MLANERMAAAPKAKGYKYQYVYSRDSGTSTEPSCRRRCPGALEYLWKTYPK